MHIITFEMFLLFLFELFNLIKSPQPTFGSFGHFYVHYYILVSDQSQCLEVLNDYPISPFLLRILIEYELHHEDMTKKSLVIISERYYFKVETPCSSSFVISNKNLKFRYINLQISVYITTQIDSQVAKFDYTFKSDIHEGQLELSDTLSNFALNIQFVYNGIRYIPPSINDYDKVVEVLKNVDEPGTRICVVTPNSVVTEIELKFPHESIRKGTITNILYRYMTDTGNTEWRSYRAWDCSGSPNLDSVGIFVRDEYGLAFLETLLGSFDYATERHYSRPFQISEEKIVKYEDSRILQIIEDTLSESLKVYLMVNKPDVITCPITGQAYAYKTAKHNIYWIEKWLETSQNGLVRKGWLPVSQEEVCPENQ